MGKAIPLFRPVSAWHVMGRPLPLWYTKIQFITHKEHSLPPLDRPISECFIVNTYTVWPKCRLFSVKFGGT